MSKKSVLGILGLSMACCVSMMGCGLLYHEDENEIVGNDWRVTGAYCYYDLEHGEISGAYVNIGVNKVIFCYDQEEQVEYTRVNLPDKTTDYDATYNSFQIYDINGDGYSDFSIVLYDQQGLANVIGYFWDADNVMFYEAYNYIEDPEVDNENNNADINYGEGDFTYLNFMGAWTTEDHMMELLIDAYGHWQQGANEDFVCAGNTEIDGGFVDLYTYEGLYYTTLTYIDGIIYDSADTAFYYDGPIEEHLNGESYINIYPDGYNDGDMYFEFVLNDGYYYSEDDFEYIYIHDGLNFEFYGYVDGGSEMEKLNEGYLVPIDNAGNFIAYSTDYDDEVGCEVFQFDTGIILWGGVAYSMD